MLEPLSSFVARWCHPDYPPSEVSEADLSRAEQELGVLFPQDFLSQMLQVGAAAPTIDLLDTIVDRGLGIHDISSLATPKQIVEDTRLCRSGGMPGHLVAIATDCSGNCFCFDSRKLVAPRKSASEVLIWDHDFGTTEVIAPSFSAWISGYLEI